MAPPLAHRGVIEESHQRCAAQGLSRIQSPDHTPLGRADLAVVLQRNQRLYSHAAPVMEMLFDQITGTPSMVVLCDAAGTIIHSIGDDDFLTRASKVALQPGVNWAEQNKGTNAIGTALMEEQPTLVHAEQHYLHANHFLTCSAAPILDPRGNILGVLDVTGDHRSYHQHTMGLVRMSARMIENHWLSDDHRDAMRLHFHSRPEFIGTLMEGILAVSPEGRITGANRGALEQLGLSGAALRRHDLVSLLGTTVAALVDRFRAPLATPLAVRTQRGQPLYVQARFSLSLTPLMPLAPPTATTSTSSPVQSSPPQGSAPPPAAALAATAWPEPSALMSVPRAAPPDAVAPGLSHLLTGDAQMGAVVAKLRRVIDRDLPVLLLGETGTGKELLARAMHQDSQRSRQPFVAVHCAAIAPAQIEAELFGCEEGGVAGQRRKASVGKIVQAHGGTLFLSEIGDMPLPLQAQLLRVLQERQVTPLGSNRSVPVDVALVCASHRDLRALMQAQAFRADLYYRLNGLAVKLPPLRDRSDLPALVQRLLQAGGSGRPLRLSAAAAALFATHRWPGNVRQLHNVLRAAALMAGPDGEIRPEHLPDDFLDEAADTALLPAPLPAWASAPSAPTMATSPLRKRAPGAASAAKPSAKPSAKPAAELAAEPAPAAGPLRSLQLQAITAAIAAAGGNISEAAKQLGVSRNTIYRQLRAAGR